MSGYTFTINGEPFTFNCECIERNQGLPSYHLEDEDFNPLIFENSPLIVFETGMQYTFNNGYLNPTPFKIKYFTFRLSDGEKELIISSKDEPENGGRLLNPLILGNFLNQGDISIPCIRDDGKVFIIKKDDNNNYYWCNPASALEIHEILRPF